MQERFKAKAKGNSGTWGVYDTLRACFVLQSVSPNAKYNKEVADKAAYLFNVSGLPFDEPGKKQPTMPLQIKVGHRYRTRSGDVVEITERNYSETYPFLGTFITGRVGYVSSFTPSGEWITGDATEDDLVFEELPGDGDLLTKK